jgi:hypothetical protein
VGRYNVKGAKHGRWLGAGGVKTTENKIHWPRGLLEIKRILCVSRFRTYILRKLPLWKQLRERNLEREGNTYTIAEIFFFK